MTNPPPWNEPIKPPNGNFTLEERKWREGITRGLNNIKIKSLGDIGDVDLTSPSANEILKFDGSNWVNGTPSVTVTNWGDIVGSLSNQTDLQDALNAKADLLSLATVATTGSYNDLSDKPTIPTVNNATLTIQKNSSNVGTFTANASSNVTIDISVPTDTNDLTNGAGYITANDIPALPSDTDLSHYDNSTSDFVDSNDLATKQDVIDNNNPLSASYVSGLATVATSGDYTDLLNKPTIPTVNDATLTIQKNGTNVATFTANASSNVTANISVPTDTSDLTNTAGYITGVSSINDIGDVTITTPSAGELLKYDGSKWINGSPSTSVTNWGDILGTLSDQTDLQSALNDKQDVIDANNKLDYSLLSNTPTIPTVNDATLTLQQNGTTVGTFTANASTNNTLNFSDTNTTSGITVNSSLVPDTDNTYNLGGSNSYWSNVYSKGYYLSQYARLSTQGTYGVGIQWQDSNSLTARNLLFINNNIYPYRPDTVALGQINYKFTNVCSNKFSLSSTAYLDAGTNTSDVAMHWSFNGNNYDVRGYHSNFMPSANNALNLGANGFRWIKVFALSGTIDVSDRRTKEYIEPLENALEKVNSINIKSFVYKNDPDHIHYGFIAQDELERNPELVYVPEDYSEEENGGELGVISGNIPYLALKAIQELSAKVTALENKLESLGV